MPTDHLARGTPSRTVWFDGYIAGLAASCRVTNSVPSLDAQSDPTKLVLGSHAQVCAVRIRVYESLLQTANRAVGPQRSIEVVHAGSAESTSSAMVLIQAHAAATGPHTKAGPRSLGESGMPKALGGRSDANQRGVILGPAQSTTSGPPSSLNRA